MGTVTGKRLARLERGERMRLLQFVCSFAWADFEVRSEEREFVRRLIEGLDLDAEEIALIEGWLESPPEIESLDPTLVPPKHRKLFVEAAEQMVAADGQITPEERDILELFEELVR